MAATVDPEEIPEVVEYLAAKEDLDKYMAEHQEIFAKFRELAEVVNTTRGQADKEVRARDVSCGPWDRYQVQVKYDAEKLYESLGREGFLEVGGKLNTVTTYDCDKSKIQAAITRGDIPKDVAEIVRVETPKYKAPKDIDIP